MIETVCMYAVSSGNGNDGVSHMFPDYYVRTNDPYRLAELALVTSFKGNWQQRALDECEVDGDADYVVSAVLYEPLDEPELDDDGEAVSWCDANGAYMIVDVFAVEDGDRPDMSDPWHRPVYKSIEDCFGRDAALVPATA